MSGLEKKILNKKLVHSGYDPDPGEGRYPIKESKADIYKPKNIHISERNLLRDRTDVEGNSENPTYGSLENKNQTVSNIKGYSGTKSLGESNKIQRKNPLTFKKMMSKPFNEKMKEQIDAKKAENTKSNNLLRNKALKKLDEYMERPVSSEEPEGKAADVARRYTYKVSKYSLKAGVASGKTIKGNIRLNKRLKEEIKAGNISQSEATTSRISIRKEQIEKAKTSLKAVAIHEIKDFALSNPGTDDPYLGSVSRARDQARKVYRGYKGTVKAGKLTVVGIRKTGRAVRKGATATSTFIKGVKKVLTNPVAVLGGIKAGSILLTVVVLMTIVVAITSIIPTFSIFSNDVELTKTYEHITKLDAELQRDISKSGNSIYINGVKTTNGTFTVNTNADYLLAYFNTKYGSYTFDSLINGVFGGKNIKQEIEELHKKLYSYSTSTGTREVIHAENWTDANGVVHDKSEPEIVSETRSNLNMKPLMIVIDEQGLMNKSEKEQMKTLLEIGQYTAKINMGSPFGDQKYFISQRWGYKYDQGSGQVVKQTGVKIPKTSGTEVKNILPGSVVATGSTSSTGTYVTVREADKEVTYGYLNSVSVAVGQPVNLGDVIGTTGKNTSGTEALYISHNINGNFNTNPAFFMLGAVAGAGSGVGNGDIVALAETQLGQRGGLPYWSWYGFNMRVEWCATFVSWNASQLGYIEQGVIPMFASCAVGINWFQNKGLWQPKGAYVPKSGDIIFIDWNPGANDGADHVGIVASFDGSTVYTIEGNWLDSVSRMSYPVNSAKIYGYGTPMYPEKGN